MNYKKPIFWLVLVILLAVSALSVALLSNPKKNSLTVEDYAKQFMEQNITSYESNGTIRIIDQQMTKLEKISAFDTLLATPLEIWSLEYRLKPDAASDLAIIENVKDGYITEEGAMGKPYLVFTKMNAKLQYLGVVRSGENDMDTSAGQEIAARKLLESNTQLPHESYPGNHVLVKFPLSSGETSQLLLSQPVVQGDTGVWAVERWKDTNGNEYYDTPQTEDTITEYYKGLQDSADKGERVDLLDPVQVAITYIHGIGQQIKRNQLVVDTEATAADFAITPESTLTGYVLNLKLEENTFDFDNIEWLTLEDSARFKGLNINPDDDMPNGFYILNKYTYTTPYKVTEETKYFLIDMANLGTKKEVSKGEFIAYFAQYKDRMPLCVITFQNEYVTSIAERYLP